MTGPSPATIFVQIASYREPELVDTILSCVGEAAHPDRLRFGVCLQYDDSIQGAGADCLDEVRERAEIRVARFPHYRSRGGCWARFVAQGLFDGEDYTFQIDAHSRVRAGWDETLIEWMHALPDRRPLITANPPLYQLVDGEVGLLEPATAPVPTMRIVDWSIDGWLHHPTGSAPPDSPLVPRRTRVLSGAFVFTLGAWNDDVRQDPEHLFTGEEFALTLRSFTSGYDLWNPPERVVWHRNRAVPQVRYFSDDPDGWSARRHERACRRLRVLLNGDPERILEPFSLGAERTLDDYWEFAGLRWPERWISEAARDGLPGPELPPGPARSRQAARA